MGNPGEYPSYTVSKNALDNLQTWKNIRGWHISHGKLFTVLEAFPHIELRHLICPSQGLHGDYHAIYFNNETVTFPNQLVGRKDGAAAVEEGPGAWTEQFRKMYIEDK